MRKASRLATNALPSLPCGCAALRRTARAVTQLYDEALRPLDLRVTQFTIMQVLDQIGSITQGDLGHVLAMDSTSLSRTLKLMEKNDWIVGVPGRDRRERQFSLTRKGRKQMQLALPRWEAVQARLQKSLGESNWSQLVAVLDRTTSAVSRA
ncbi:MAG: MarR family transcriptional regulator [Alphaproteobacteria bacterium]